MNGKPIMPIVMPFAPQSENGEPITEGGLEPLPLPELPKFPSMITASIKGVHVDIDIIKLERGANSWDVHARTSPSYQCESSNPFPFEVKDALCIKMPSFIRVGTAFDIPPMSQTRQGKVEQEYTVPVHRSFQPTAEEVVTEFKELVAEGKPGIQPLFLDKVTYKIRIKPLPLLPEPTWSDASTPLVVGENFTVTINDGQMRITGELPGTVAISGEDELVIE